MIEIVRVIAAKPLGQYRLWVRFCDGQEGVRDYSDMIADGGPMVEPLRDPSFFARVFVVDGVPTWPNGFDVDAIALHMELAERGLLTRSAAA